MQTLPFSLELEQWELIRSFLPDGWQQQARLSGALRRARGVPDAETLLRVLLLHLACGCSLAETALRAKLGGLAKLSAVAVFKRLQTAEPWLRWMAQQMRGAAQLPWPAAGRKVRAVDATVVSEPGPTGSQWKIHYAVNLGDLECDFFLLSGKQQSGETFRRVPPGAGDILLGDRVYAAPPGIAHVRQAGADVVVRWNRQALPLFDAQGERIDALDWVRGLEYDQLLERFAQARRPRGGWIEGRLLALRRSPQATALARRKMKRRAQRSQKTVSDESWEMAEYFTLWTSLEAGFAGPQILEMYRLRWQIELVFKRMKSIVGLGHLPKEDPRSAQAWLQGKLLVGLLIEKMLEKAQAFSPWGYELRIAKEPLEGDGVDLPSKRRRAAGAPKSDNAARPLG